MPMRWSCTRLLLPSRSAHSPPRGGPALFRFLGADGDTLAKAVLYSNAVFAAAIPGWIVNVLASALRGSGNVRVPALVTAVGSVVTLALSPLLILGWGFVPGLGV